MNRAQALRGWRWLVAGSARLGGDVVPPTQHAGELQGAVGAQILQGFPISFQNWVFACAGSLEQDRTLQEGHPAALLGSCQAICSQLHPEPQYQSAQSPS